MKRLKDKIEREGKVLGKGIIKVDSFMNHQIDPLLMKEIGIEMASRFEALNPTKILTAETSGIAPALSTAMTMGIPVVFARKHKPVTMSADALTQSAESRTFGKSVELFISPEYLTKDDRILIVDDFLSTARTISALTKLVEQSGAVLLGIGVVIEKSFEGGRAVLSSVNVPIESLAIIERFDGERIVFQAELAALS